MNEKIAVIGSGLIGRAWAITFARAGYAVEMTDINADALNQSVELLKGSLEDLAEHDLLNGQDVDTVTTRISPQESVAADAARSPKRHVEPGNKLVPCTPTNVPPSRGPAGGVSSSTVTPCT